MSDTKKDFVVTDAAGPRPEVAGKRVTAGDTLTLSAVEAEYELSRGVIMEADVYAQRKANAEKANPPAPGSDAPSQDADKAFNSPLPDGLGQHSPVGGVPGVTAAEDGSRNLTGSEVVREAPASSEG